MPDTPDPWIGVPEVAAELNITPRRAWELIKRLGVEKIDGPQHRMDEARFRLSKWEAARDAAQRPAPARAPRVKPASAAPAAKPVAGPTGAAAAARTADRMAAKLAALRNA